MFVIKSTRLKTNVNVENEDIIGNPSTLKIGDETKFLYKSKIYSGVIIRKPDPKPKRERGGKRSYSPSDYDDKKSNKKKKNDNQTNESQRPKKDEYSSSNESSDDNNKDEKYGILEINSSLDDSNELENKELETEKADPPSGRKESSVDKSSLKKTKNSQLRDKKSTSLTSSSSIVGKSANKENELNGSNNHGSQSGDNLVQSRGSLVQSTGNLGQPGFYQLHLDDDNHLFGGANDDMILLKNNIYVKKRVLDTAIRTSSQASHIARQLLEGIVKPEFLKRSTLTGKALRGKKDPNIIPLHGGAKDAIIAYVQDVARSKNWTAQDEKTIEKSIGQKLTEIRTADKKNQEIRNYQN